MKASNVFKALFPCSVQEYILGANSSKIESGSEDSRSDNEREEGEGGWKANKVVERLLVTKFSDKYFSYSQFITLVTILPPYSVFHLHLHHHTRQKGWRQ